MVVVVMAGVFAAASAHAQRPVCPQPSPEQLYYVACRPRMQIRVLRFLSDFSVDHFFKTAPPPFERSPLKFVELFGAMELSGNDTVREYLESLASIQFTKLDTSTGIFQLDLEEEARSFQSVLDVWGKDYDISLHLPARLEGGYWRTPAVLQMVFWQDKRAGFAVSSKAGLDVKGELSCLSLSAEGIRLVTTDPDTPDLMVAFEGCQ